MANNTKKLPVNPKKLPYYLALILLTAGASLILGFLSFGGMFALLPVLPLAFAAFILSVAYEGEIYLQNIKGAFKKLFKSNYLEHHLAKEYLLNNFPVNTKEDDCPQFFKDYENQLTLLHKFSHKQLDKENKKRKKQIEKELSDMEKWFALHLFSPKKSQTAYAQELRTWLEKNHQTKWQATREKLTTRQSTFNGLKAFSLLSAAFMGLGSTYLLVEAFSVIPWIVAIPFGVWPIMIIPMALIAGAAYGMLTYNTMTDLINNETLNKWYTKIKKDLNEGLTLRSVFLAAMAILLTGLAIALTICTAGTWWTVATSASPLFTWMGKMPSFIMGIINPAVTGLSAISFNIQNTAETLEMIDEATRPSTKNHHHSTLTHIKEMFSHENWLQRLNPFRIILKLTVTPLRLLLFIGHLISIALTADRMPGIPQILSALIALISEGFEDAHYFFEHQHSHHEHTTQAFLNERLGAHASHNHNVDIPTRLLKFLALPLYALATTWDYLTSQLNHNKALTFTEAWKKQSGIKKNELVKLPDTTPYSSDDWQKERTVYLIEKYETKHLKGLMFGSELAKKKIDELNSIKADIAKTADSKALLEKLASAAQTSTALNQHRLFAIQKDTDTQTFIEELPKRIARVR